MIVSLLLIVFAFGSHLPHAAEQGSVSLSDITPSVVSVKPSVRGSCSASYQINPDGLSVRNYPLYAIVSIAYALGHDPRTQAGLPDWASEECFDIVAKFEEKDIARFSALSREDKGKILQSVLIERFGLKSHREIREFPVYALVVAKGGAKLTHSTGKSDVGDKLIVKLAGRYQADVKNATMDDLCNMILSTEAQQMTVDQTHLEGRYDFTLRWTRPDEHGTYDAPEIFEAVKQQLGLELVKRKVPETVLVVDEIHRPTPN